MISPLPKIRTAVQALRGTAGAIATSRPVKRVFSSRGFRGALLGGTLGYSAFDIYRHSDMQARANAHEQVRQYVMRQGGKDIGAYSDPALAEHRWRQLVGATAGGIAAGAVGTALRAGGRRKALFRSIGNAFQRPT